MQEPTRNATAVLCHVPDSPEPERRTRPPLLLPPAPPPVRPTLGEAWVRLIHAARALEARAEEMLDELYEEPEDGWEYLTTAVTGILWTAQAANILESECPIICDCPVCRPPRREA